MLLGGVWHIDDFIFKKYSVSRDGRAKEYSRMAVRIITDEVHPYTFFISTLLLEKRCRDASRTLIIIPMTLVHVLFGPTIPTYFFKICSCIIMQYY